jgi:hypothetical protein
MAERDETYNGWKNYPTWAVNLWLSNDEGLYYATMELVSSQRTMNPGLEMPGLERQRIADYLKHWVRDELAPDLGASFAADLLGYALDEVDWYEIADAWIEGSDNGT